MNIILIVIDTLRYDYIGAHGNNWIQTPNMDKLAEKSWIFDQAYTASYPTIPQRTDVITGRYGRPFNPWMPLQFDVTTLPRVLSRAGYATQLIHDTPHLVNGGHNFDWPFHACTSIRGAEVDRPWIDDKPFEFLDNWKLDPLFDSLGNPEMKEIWGHTLVTYTRANRGRKQLEDWNAAKLFFRAANFLQDNAKRDNFFLWVDCFDPHPPTDAPPEYVQMYDKTAGYDGRIDPRALFVRNNIEMIKRLSEEGKQRMKAFYAAKVSMVDHWFGQVLGMLEETGLDKNTALILTADHGTCVGEYSLFTKRLWGHAGEQEGHIPMIIYVPGLGAGHSDIMVQPQDVFSTVVGIAGVDKPIEVDGYNLLALIERGVTSPRQVALMGAAPNAWPQDPEGPLFTVFDREWYLNFAPNPEVCRLFRYGSTNDMATSNPAVVEKLGKVCLEELTCRGTDPKLINWLQSEGRERFPSECCTWPGPPNWKVYWERLYNKW